MLRRRLPVGAPQPESAPARHGFVVGLVFESSRYYLAMRSETAESSW